MQLRKSQLSEEAGQDDHADEGVVEDLGVEVEVDKLNQLKVNVIREPNTQTCRLGSGKGAPCISGGGVQLFSVLNQALVLGRTFSLQSQRSEGRASSKKLLQT